MDDMNAHEKTRLDRIEEKISAQEESTRIILKRMVDQDDRLRMIERDLSHVEDTTRTVKSVVWTITTALIGSIVAAFVWMFDIPSN